MAAFFYVSVFLNLTYNIIMILK